MPLITVPYIGQEPTWPHDGRHIMAQYDSTTAVVYQAFRPDIGRYAVDHQRFGGPFSMNRMSWVKPNFLWMMYRSGWGTKTDQQVTLAVTLRREAFDEILAGAVHSTFAPEVYDSPEEWRVAVARSSVRLQWDPDHAPGGEPLRRRAVQLGLRDEALRRYAHEWIASVEDISAFVAEQRRALTTGGTGVLVTPAESVYPVGDPAIALRIGVDRQLG